MNQEQVRRDFFIASYGILLSFVLRLVRDRPTAEDITQGALMAVLSQPAFDPDRGPASVSYLKRKARWLVRDHHRRLARGLEPLPADLVERRPSLPNQALEREELRERVRRGVALLPEAQREVVGRHLSGMDHEQIAADLRVPVAVVYRRFHAAKGALRRLLEGARRA
jgi:RNA polymerase sigma factor (sigma-70 family)